MICQATVAGQGFQADDYCAPWCVAQAESTVPLRLTQQRTVNVWLCPEHLHEFIREMDA